MLTGKFTRNTQFAPTDHRSFNRHGEAFDVGETFAGVPFDVGLESVRRLAPLAPPGATMAQFALRWIIDQTGVSVVIPGARNPDQARANAATADLAPINADVQRSVRALYDEVIREYVQDRW